MIKFLLKDANEEARTIAHQVKFVLRAVSKDPIKPAFTKLLSDKGVIVGCDSRRLHTAEVTLPDGFYDVIKNTASEIILEQTEFDGQYPNYKQVLCSDRENFVPLKKFDSKFTGGAQTIFQIAQAGYCVNTNFIEDACKDAGDMRVSFGEGADSPVVILNELGRAVIMPIAIKPAPGKISAEEI